MTTFIVVLGQRATGLAQGTSVRVADASGVAGAEAKGGAWTLDRGAHCARSPLTTEGMAAYAGVMTTFTGTDGNDTADASTGTLTGFTGGTVADLQDATGNSILAGGGDDTIVAGHGSDVIRAGAGNDTIAGGSGADTIDGGVGDDIIILANGDFTAFESIAGQADSAAGDRDKIVLTNATNVDFTIGTISGTETLMGSTGDDTVTMTMTQWAGFVSRIDLDDGLDVLNVRVNGDISTLGVVGSISGVDTGNLIGTNNDDNVKLTGAQLDAILIGSGGIDLGDGTDTLYLTSTSEDLNVLGDDGLQGVNAISAASATASMRIYLDTQTEKFEITGGAGNDVLAGGTGDDTITGGAGADRIYAKAGADRVDGGADADTISGLAGNDTIDGGDGDDTINGGDADDNLVGGVGNDTIIGAAGNDTIDGGLNDDTINGGDGDDNLLGGLGNDMIIGGAGDKIDGGEGDDTITCDGSDVSIAGGVGYDTLIVIGDLSGKVTGIEKLDASSMVTAVKWHRNENSGGVLIGGSGNDEIYGGKGNDTIAGGGGADTLKGGWGDDTINLANGDFTQGEQIDGSGGSDKIVLTNETTVDFTTGYVSEVDMLMGSGGNDTVTMFVEDWWGYKTIDLGGGSNNLNIKVSENYHDGWSLPAAPTNISHVSNGSLTGTKYDDRATLTGANLDAILIGDAGMINLGAGKDSIDLTSTSKDLNSAKDSLIVGLEEITACYAEAGVTISVSKQNEAFTITGGDYADTITGGKGNDILTGGTGKDTLTGGAGKDTFFFHSALSAANSDKITDFSVVDDTIRLENEGFKALKATGALASAAFYVGEAAHDGSVRIIYDKATGALSYDADGWGRSAAVQFATLAKGLALTHADFVVV